MAVKGYANATEIAGILGLSTTETQTIAQINLFLEAVEELVDQYCQTTFVAESDTNKTFNGTGTEILVPGKFIRTLNSVWVLDDEGVADYEITDAVLMPDAPRMGVYRWIERRQYDGGANTFPKGLQNIQVNADWGFATIPAQVKLAVSMGIQHCWNMRDFNQFIMQETGFGRNIIYNESQKLQFLPEMSRKILDSFVNTRWFSV